MLHSLSVLFVIFPTSFIVVTVESDELSFSVAHVILPLPIIVSSIQPHAFPLPMPLSIFIQISDIVARVYQDRNVLRVGNHHELAVVVVDELLSSFHGRRHISTRPIFSIILHLSLDYAWLHCLHLHWLGRVLV